MRVYQFRHLGAAVVEGRGFKDDADARPNDARTILTVPILCQRAPHILAASPPAASVHA